MTGNIRSLGLLRSGLPQMLKRKEFWFIWGDSYGLEYLAVSLWKDEKNVCMEYLSFRQSSPKGTICLKLLIVCYGDPDYSIDSLTEKDWREAEYPSECSVKIPTKTCHVPPFHRGERRIRPLWRWKSEPHCDTVRMAPGICVSNQTPRHNGNVECSRREGQKRFYSCHIFFPLDDYLRVHCPTCLTNLQRITGLPFFDLGVEMSPANFRKAF